MKKILSGLFVAFMLHVQGQVIDQSPQLPFKAKVLTFGDEIASQITSPLEVYLGTNVVDKGKTNDTIQSALSRLNKDVLLERPDYAVIIIGDHDLKTSWGITESRFNLYLIVDRIQQLGVTVVLVDVGVEDPDNPIHSAVRKDLDPLWVENVYVGYTNLASRIADVILKHAIEGLPAVAPILSINLSSKGNIMIGWWAHKNIMYEILENDGGSWRVILPFISDNNRGVLVELPNKSRNCLYKVRATRTASF
jgi:hypothetical protein